MPAMAALREFRRPKKGAKCAGIHLEGPFLSYAKRGAQAADNLHKPDAAMFHRLNEASGGQVRLVTVAPEEETSCTRPGISERNSAFTGTTNRPSRWVIRFSCSARE